MCVYVLSGRECVCVCVEWEGECVYVLSERESVCV